MIALALLAAVAGCGERPAGEDQQQAADTAAVQETPEVGLDLSAQPLAVGQWISFGVDQEPGVMKISVVAQETFQGEDCMWLQFEGGEGGDVFQILVSPGQLETAMSAYTEAADEFLADPALWMEQNIESLQDGSMMTTEENIQNFLALLRGLKMAKVSQNGTVMAYDLSNVPGVLEPMLTDSAFLAQIQTGIQAESYDPHLADSVAAKLAEYEFAGEAVEMTIAGTSVSGSRFTAVGPDVDAEVFFSGDLPILPFGMARFTNLENGEEHVIEARGFGSEGAVNLMTQPPAQTIDVAPMIQMMIAQMQAQAGQTQNPR
jgi:hypothetical protein